MDNYSSIESLNDERKNLVECDHNRCFETIVRLTEKESKKVKRNTLYVCCVVVYGLSLAIRVGID